MPGITTSIPAEVLAEYAKALQSDQLSRDASFLTLNGRPITERIAGFEVQQMNLNHYLALRIAGNPILYGAQPETIATAAIAQFIWILSVDYSPDSAAQERWFRASGLLEPLPPKLRTRARIDKWADKMAACMELQHRAAVESCEYIRQTFRDRPPAASGGVAHYSDACFWCARMAREFTIDPREVMTIPLKQLFQYLNEIKDYHNQRAMIVNPAAEILAKWQADIQPRSN